MNQTTTPAEPVQFSEPVDCASLARGAGTATHYIVRAFDGAGSVEFSLVCPGISEGVILGCQASSETVDQDIRAYLQALPV